jgi:hypothetical protein
MMELFLFGFKNLGFSKFPKILSPLRYFHPPPTPPIKGGEPAFLPRGRLGGGDRKSTNYFLAFCKKDNRFPVKTQDFFLTNRRL